MTPPVPIQFYGYILIFVLSIFLTLFSFSETPVVLNIFIYLSVIRRELSSHLSCHCSLTQMHSSPPPPTLPGLWWIFCVDSLLTLLGILPHKDVPSICSEPGHSMPVLSLYRCCPSAWTPSPLWHSSLVHALEEWMPLRFIPYYSFRTEWFRKGRHLAPHLFISYLESILSRLSCWKHLQFKSYFLIKKYCRILFLGLLKVLVFSTY